jgi:hypothetical protein
LGWFEASVYAVVGDGDFVWGDGEEAHKVVLGLVRDGDDVVGSANCGRD